MKLLFLLFAFTLFTTGNSIVQAGDDSTKAAETEKGKTGQRSDGSAKAASCCDCPRGKVPPKTGDGGTDVRDPESGQF